MNTQQQIDDFLTGPLGLDTSDRYQSSNRYVPLTLIFDVFSNNPALTYFKLKNANQDYIDTFGIINTKAQNALIKYHDYIIQKQTLQIHSRF